jgi:diguanylate cyclase (GGDEF)-like protein
MAASHRDLDLGPTTEAPGDAARPPAAGAGLLGRLARALAGGPEAPRDAVLAERMATVLDVAQRLNRTLDRREILRTIVLEADRLLAAEGSTIRLLEGDLLVPAAWAGISDADAARLPVFRADEGWLGAALRQREPLVIEDIRTTDLPSHRRYAADLAFAGAIVVPLARGDRIIGVLACTTEQPRCWTADDIEFANALATHASIALHNAEMFERTERRAERLAVLQAASARMNRAKTVESVGRAIVEETRLVLDYHNARVYLLEGQDLVPIAFEGRVGEYDKVDFALLRTTVGVGFTGWVAQHAAPLLVGDANADPRGATIPGTDDVDESMLVVPMRSDDGVAGVITLSKLGIDQFDEDDLQLLTILADQAATAVESARLLARSQSLTTELRQLVDMSSALSGSLDPRQVASLIAQHLARAMGVDECAISYWDRAGARVLTLGYWPEAAPGELQESFDIGGYPETLRVLETQTTIVLDAADPTADSAEVALMRADGNRMLAMFPLVAKGQSIGLVELLSKSPVTFDEDLLALGRTMANEAAMALENARLYEDARKLADRDPLTGFYNHRYLHERLGEEVIRAQRARRPLSVLMLDMDDFKLVNDTFGHLFGDRVLVWTAERIRSTLRAPDVAARYGGDEFAILLPDADPDAARAAAQRILRTFGEHPYEGEGRGPVPMGLSIGIATHPVDGRTPTELIAAADQGLYEVKRAGGHGVQASGPVSTSAPAQASLPAAPSRLTRRSAAGTAGTPAA